MELYEYVFSAEEGGQTGHGHMIHTLKKLSTYLLWEDVQGKQEHTRYVYYSKSIQGMYIIQ